MPAFTITLHCWVFAVLGLIYISDAYPRRTFINCQQFRHCLFFRHNYCDFDSSEYLLRVYDTITFFLLSICLLSGSTISGIESHPGTLLKDSSGNGPLYF